MQTSKPNENCSDIVALEKTSCVLFTINHHHQQQQLKPKLTLIAYVDRLFCGFLQRFFVYPSSPPSEPRPATVVPTLPVTVSAKRSASEDASTITNNSFHSSMFNDKTVAASVASDAAAVAAAPILATATVASTSVASGAVAAGATVANAAGSSTAAPFHPFQMIAPKINRQPKQTPITDDFEISTTVLGQGINGKVVQCTNRKTGHLYALKVLNDNSKARREVDLHWRASGCRHIVQIVAVYENTYGEHKCLLVVMEW